MPELAPKERPTRPARDIERGGPSMAPLHISYYRRMKPQRVYPWVVTWQKGANDRKGPDQNVTLRLLMAGAQVVPAEQTINAADANARATFYVTPLAKGWLRAQRLEVSVGGRKVQEIPLASQVISQRGTLILLLLTFLLPWLIWQLIQSNSQLGAKTIVEKGKRFDGGQENPISTVKNQTVLPYKRAEAMEKIIRDLMPKVPALLDEEAPEPMVAPSEAQVETEKKEDSKPPQEEPKKQKGGQLKPPKGGDLTKMQKGDMAKILKGDLAQALKEGQPEEPTPPEKPQTWRSSVKTAMEQDMPKSLGKFLVEASDFCRELKLPTYVFLLFLLLTIASAWCCRPKRKNAYGKPIPLSIATGNTELE